MGARRPVRPAPGPSRRPQGLQPIGDVIGIGIDGGDPQKELPGPRKLTRTFREIGQDVPLSKVSLGRVPDESARPGFNQEVDGAGQVPVVGSRASEDETTLGEDLGIG
jgi:hypothetical protein